MHEITTPEAPRAIGPYAQAIAVDGWLFTSGGILTAKRRSCAGDRSPDRTVFDNLSAPCWPLPAYPSAGSSSAVFVKDLNDFARLNAVYERRFGDHKPARSTVGAPARDVKSGSKSSPAWVEGHSPSPLTRRPD